VKENNMGAGTKNKPSTRLKVNERSLIQRINRKLKEDGEQLRTARSEKVEQQVGHHFVIDIQRNFISKPHVDLEKLGRELDVLQGWEELEEE